VKDIAVHGARGVRLTDLVGYVLGKNDVPEPSAWRPAPQAALAALSAEEKKSYIAALLPLVRSGRELNRANLRRLYQLFAFMELPTADRLTLVGELENQSDPALVSVPFFGDRVVRCSLWEEAELFAENAPSRAAFNYTALLRLHLKVKRANSRKLMRLFDKLTDVENRAASLLGKRGHVVRFHERRLELFKKSVAAVGVPAAVLFPLGSIGLSAEGVTTGLIVLGGGFILPAGLAMVTGLGVAVAMGITTKKLLDMLMPTIDADRSSIDIQQLRRGVLEVQNLVDEVTVNSADSVNRETVRERIAEIMQRIAPLSEAQRARIESALEQAHFLSDRYSAMLEEDTTILEQRHDALGRELGRVLASELRVAKGLTENRALESRYYHQ
jgi:hypothetical protein